MTACIRCNELEHELQVIKIALSIETSRAVKAESVAPPSVAMQDILTDNCVLCGFEKDDHYDGVQCPIAHGKYHATQVFSSRIDAPLVPNPQKLLTELPALNVSNDDLVKACDTWRGEEDKYEIQAEVYCRERQLLAALNEIETLRPLAIMVAKSSGEGSGVPALILEAIGYCSDGPVTLEDALDLLRKKRQENDDWQKQAESKVIELKAALSSPLQGWISFQQEWPPLRETVEVYFPEPELALCRRELEELADDNMSEPENILWDIVCDQERITAGAIWRKHTPPDTKGGS